MTRAETENNCTCCYPLLSQHRVLHHTLPTGQAQVYTACKHILRIYFRLMLVYPLKYLFENEFLAVRSSKMNILVKLVLCIVCLLIMYVYVMLLMLMLSAVCLKCDMQERLLSPALLPSTPDLGVKTESMHDFQPPNKSLPNPSAQCLRVVKYSQICS